MSFIKENRSQLCLIPLILWLLIGVAFWGAHITLLYPILDIYVHVYHIIYTCMLAYIVSQVFMGNALHCCVADGWQIGLPIGTEFVRTFIRNLDQNQFDVGLREAHGSFFLCFFILSEGCVRT